MVVIINNILLFLFIMSIVYIIYMIGRIIHLIVGLKNDMINEINFKDIKEELFSYKNLKVFWISVSYFLFYLFK